MNKIKHRSNIAGLALFMLWPFGMFLNSIINFKNQQNKNYLWFFISFIGLGLIITSEEMDAYGYAQEFRYIVENHKGFTFIFSALFEDSTALDIFKPLMLFLVSRITDNPSIYFGIIALVYGFFFSRNFYYVVSKVEGNFTRFQILIVFAFLFIVPMQAFQFVRFSTATHVFLYGALPFLFDRNRKHLIWVVASIFFHFSFILPVALFFIYLILPKNLHLLFVFYLLSTFFIQVSLESVNSVLFDYSPDLLMDKVESYGNVNYAIDVNNRMAATNWYIQFYGKSIDFAILALIILIYFSGGKYLRRNKAYMSLFCFVLFLTSIANIISVFPSASRFIGVSRLFALPVILFMISYIKNTPFFGLFRALTAPLLLFFIVVSLRFLVDSVGISIFISNPALIFIFQDEKPVIAFIKEFLS